MEIVYEACACSLMMYHWIEQLRIRYGLYGVKNQDDLALVVLLYFVGH